MTASAACCCADRKHPICSRAMLKALRVPKNPPLLAGDCRPRYRPAPSGPASKSRARSHAFEEPAEPPFRRTKAVVVVHEGRVIAERYAPGVRVDTQLVGFSMTKSVVNALLGILNPTRPHLAIACRRRYPSGAARTIRAAKSRSST